MSKLKKEGDFNIPCSLCVKSTGQLSRRKNYLTALMEPYQIDRQRATALQRAVLFVTRDSKTFVNKSGFPVISKSLQDRGWIEKYCPDSTSYDHLLSASALEAFARYICCYARTNLPPNATSREWAAALGLSNSDVKHLARLLHSTFTDLVWVRHLGSRSGILKMRRGQLINRLPKASFTTKVGLCTDLQYTHWYEEENVSHVRFPRCFVGSSLEVLKPFKENFHLSACICLLRWAVEMFKAHGDNSITAKDGKVPLTALTFAVDRCNEYLKICNHEDIDKVCYRNISDAQWSQFLESYYAIVHEDKRFESSDKKISESQVCHSARTTIASIEKQWPGFAVDGTRNIWIVKPGYSTRGCGIHVMNRLQDIISTMTATEKSKNHYVVQKYIERPLLIRGTKFDIRQWFLVTSVYPLTVWMYKHCYCRFSSQPFTLNNLHESIHLCNNAIQRKYVNGTREAGLPEENMWDYLQFTKYLTNLGKLKLYKDKIFPEMCQAIVATLLAAQERMEERKHCFELFGADFMLDEQYQPWLIEINCNPSMEHSTSVTARMCEQVQEDIIKVVIDWHKCAQADTGLFVMVYQQRWNKGWLDLKDTHLSVQGRQMSPRFVSQKEYDRRNKSHIFKLEACNSEGSSTTMVETKSDTSASTKSRKTKCKMQSKSQNLYVTKSQDTNSVKRKVSRKTHEEISNQRKSRSKTGYFQNQPKSKGKSVKKKKEAAVTGSEKNMKTSTDVEPKATRRTE